MHGNLAPALPAIREQIEASDNGRISFADFMETSLYHPDEGYYTNRVAIGAGRDFHTWSDHPVFGACVADAVIKEWHLQDRPREFTVLEMGAGTGALARTILAHITNRAPQLRDTLRYRIAEISPHLMSQQQRTLGRDMGVEWLPGSATDLPLERGEIQGIAFSNELVDAFPVHRVVRKIGGLCERFVTIDENDTLTTIDAPLSEEVHDLPELRHTVLGFEKVVSPGSKAWMQTMGHVLAEGSKLITIDYGSLDYRQRLHRSPVRTYGELAVQWRPAGVTPAVKLSEEGPVEIALKHPGLVDITYDVNFGALQEHGRVNGLRTEAYDSQAVFLLRHDLLQHAEEYGMKDLRSFDSRHFRVLQQRQVA